MSITDEVARHRRLNVASSLEVYVYLLILLAAVYLRYESARESVVGVNNQSEAFNNTYLLTQVLSSPVVIGVSVLLFVSILSFLLSQQTPLVAYLSRAGSVGFFTRIFPFLPRDNLKHDAAVSPSESLENIGGPGSAFEVYINRSQSAAKTAQGRPNALLFIGGLVAFLGLVFFFLTLPGSTYISIRNADVQMVPRSSDLWSAILQILPRLLMLAFIQILAGFFLRQYRAAMEDFRYYEAVLRHREAQYLSYLIRNTVDYRTPRGKSLVSFSGDLMKEQEFGILRSGQTTASLAALAAEQNDMATLYEKIAETFSSLASRTASSVSKKTKAGVKAKTTAES
jgi:hypothetical protein